MLKFAIKTAPLILGTLTLALAGCPGDDVTAGDTDGDDSSGDDTTTVTPATMSNTDTTPTPDTDTGTTVDPDSSSGGVMCDPECEFGQCCVGGACFNAPAPTCDGGCEDNEECICPEGMDPCDCVGECVAGECGIEGNYDPCFDVMCPAGYVCLSDNPMAPTIGWCALGGCTDECDCPLPLEEGIPVDCDDITGSGMNHCFMSCAGGGACPEGMVCFADFCAWPAVVGGEPLFGDCVNGGQCDVSMGLTCLSDMDVTFGWCSMVDCADDMDCMPVPDTGDATPVCAPILNMGMTNACILDCSMGQECPDQMSCFMDQFCVWTEFQDGYDNCGLPAVDCQMDEVCLADMPMMGDPAWAVCSQTGCTDAGDCGYLAPEGGDAMAACGDPTMAGADSCYLDCSGGEMCPDGMICQDTSFCAWPQGAAVFQDDFETGDFMMGGWTLNDVDMQMPFAGETDFVTDAWVVSDFVDGGMGMNLAATSTSWYDPAGQSDDWLISPLISLGPNSRLYWRARSFSGDFPDGYEVRISTATTDPMDFMANAELFTIAAEDSDYQLRFVDLAAAGYMDQDVYIAWRNVTNDGWLLTVDDVIIQELP